jgi:hypothetical protein
VIPLVFPDADGPRGGRRWVLMLSTVADADAGEIRGIVLSRHCTMREALAGCAVARRVYLPRYEGRSGWRLVKGGVR